MKFFMYKAIITKTTGKIAAILSVLLTVATFSCEDFVDVPPPVTQLAQEKVFEDDATALAALAGIYVKLADQSSFAGGGSGSITVVEGLYADELTSYSVIGQAIPRVEFYFNSVSPLNSVISSTWAGCYKIIYECNRILEGVHQSNKLSLSVRDLLSGEARFIRAFCHFYLVNLFGDVPLITTSDYRVNAQVSRSPVEKVYEGIVADLLAAKDLLSDDYPTEGRVRVNRGAVTALLARVYLYQGDYANAEIMATEVINKTSQYRLPSDLNTVFLKTSEEAIWQLLPPEDIEQKYTNEGAVFVLFAPPTNCALKNELYHSFDTSDLRRINWVGNLSSTSGATTWYYPYKYKEGQSNGTGSEYSVVLRLAEQYLIRAEARAQLNKLNGPNGADGDINVIRSRAGLPGTTSSAKEDLLKAIEHERRVELFTEWGHRFFDLKRTGRLDAVLDPVKLNWDNTDALLPLPQAEMLINQNLKPQNPGY
jgi:starch-binding outer membrane protein, SusD/RagB family